MIIGAKRQDHLGRLYVEPVEVSGKGIEAAVKEVMQGKKNT
jgi:hypothetical protein